MIFNSFTFLIFLFVVLTLYWNSNSLLRLKILFISSIIFYGFWRVEFIPLLLFSVFINYYAAKKIHISKQKKIKKKYLFLSLFTNFGLLGFFKYFYFFYNNGLSLLNLIGINFVPIEINILLPIGISFYTFQSVSYAVDIYKGNVKPVNNFTLFSTYIIFFPQLVAGPILRAGEVIWQFEKKKIFNLKDFKIGFERIIFGLFLKVVLADNISKFVDSGFLMNPKLMSALDVLTLSYLFGFQIYFDFSGYSHIAIGSALMFGIKLKENFNFPYHSISPKYFWRRWHITLSSWVRDYIYLPLLKQKSLNKSEGGFSQNLISLKLSFYTIYVLFITWSLMGLWHGASWNFIAWGIWNFLIIILFRYIDLINNFSNSKISKILSWAVTLQLVMLGWIFFRAETLSLAFQMINCLFYIKNWTFITMGENVYLITFFTTIFYLISPYFLNLFRKLQSISTNYSEILKNVLITLALTLVIIYFKVTSEFIYFQF